MWHNIVIKMLKVTECSDLLLYIFIKLQFSNLNIFLKLNCCKTQLYKNQKESAPAFNPDVCDGE